MIINSSKQLQKMLTDLLIIGFGTALIFAFTYVFTPKPVNK